MRSFRSILLAVTALPLAFGAGALTVNDVETLVSAGAAAFIPGDAQHSLRNDGPEELRIFYVFPTDCFSQVVYQFAEDGSSAA